MSDALKLGTILVKRPWAFCWGARRFLVWIDERKFGHVRCGESKEFYLEPGTHTVAVQCDWAKARPVTVEVKENGTTTVTCGATIWYRQLFDPRLWFDFASQIYVKSDADLAPWWKDNRIEQAS